MVNHKEKKLNKLSSIFFYLFLIFLPFNIRLIVYKEFNDFVSLFLYLGDILLILAFIFWGYKRVLGFQIFKNVNLKYQLLFILLFIFLFIELFSMLKNGFSYYSIQSISQTLIGGLLFCHILANISQKRQIKNIIFILIALAFLESTLGIYQFTNQKSLGLYYFGESKIAGAALGIAKIDLNGGEKVVRAYGTFPHPNVFAGFLLIAFMALILRKYFKYLENENDFQDNEEKTGFFKSSIFAIFWLILAISFVLTFSRAAFLVFCIILLTILIKYVVVKIKTKISFKEFLLKHRIQKNYKTLVIFSIVFIVFLSAVLPLFESRFLNSNTSRNDVLMKNRSFYNNIALKIISKEPFLGVGPGLFPLVLGNFSDAGLYTWDFQPVHNVFLLIASEEGLIGLFVFLLFIFVYLRIMFHPAPFTQVQVRDCRVEHLGKAMFHVEQSNQSAHAMFHVKHFSFVLGVFTIGIFVLMLFDHYFWTIHSAHLLFWLILAIFLKTKEILDKSRVFPKK